MIEKKELKNKHRIFQVSQKTLFYDPDEKQFILFRSANTEGGRFYKEYGPWDIVGGRIDADGENVNEALKREISEEAGEEIQYSIMEVLGRVEMDYSFGPVITIGFLAIYEGGEIILSAEHTEWRKATAEEIEKDEEIKPWLKEFVKIAATRLKEREYLDDIKRLQADFENYKKRMTNDREDIKRFITQGIISDLVPILDNFNMAVAHVPEDKRADPWVTGITYIERQFEEVIAGYGVNVMEVKPGDAFDPMKHEAIGSEQEATNSEQGVGNIEQGTEDIKAHKIAKVMQKGYTMGDKVIRAAKVIVS